MRNIFLALLLSVCAITTVEAQLPTTGLSGGVAVSSDYFFRGVSQHGGNAVLSGNLDLDVGPITVGAWASQVDFGNDATFEYDFYANFAHDFGAFSLNAGVIHYGYNGDDVDAVNEYVVGGSVGPVSANYYMDMDDTKVAYWEGSVRLPTVLGLMPSVQYGRHVDGVWDLNGHEFFALDVHKHFGDLVLRAKIFDFVEFDDASTFLDGAALSVEYGF